MHDLLGPYEPYDDSGLQTWISSGSGEIHADLIANWVSEQKVKQAQSLILQLGLNLVWV